jgi:polyisoprenoid-binding protein YceI
MAAFRAALFSGIYLTSEENMQATSEQTGTGRATWNIDTDHTHVGFSVRHMMITTVKGQFSGVTGTLELDEGNPAASRVSVRIDAASIDTRVEQRDAHLRSGDFLDVENHPYLTFESRAVRPLGGRRLEVQGDLTIRGVTKPVVLEVTEEGRGTDPWGGERAAFSATGRLDRRDFGLVWNQALEAGGVLVSDDVKLTIDLQVVRA